MLKYYVLLFLVIGSVLTFVFLQDPCNESFRTDFSERFPHYKILDFGGKGDTDKVYCHITYQKSDSKQVYEDIWVYVNADNGWEFLEAQQSGIKATLPESR